MKRVLKRLWDRIFVVLNRFFSQNGKSDVPCQPKKILVLQLQHLGDSLIFTPTLRALKYGLSDVQIDMVVNKMSYEVYKHNPYIDNFYKIECWPWGFREKRIPYFLYSLIEIIARIKEENYDCVVLDTPQVAFKFSLIAFLTGIQCRIGFNINNKGFLNTIQVPFDDRKSFLRCNLDILAILNLQPKGIELDFYTSQKDVRNLQGKLPKSADNFVVIHPGAKWPSKMWFTDRFATTADELISKYGVQIIFAGSKSECTVVEEIQEKMVYEDSSFSLAGNTTLSELAVLFQMARAIICLDSGPMHIATSTRTPTVVLMSTQDLSHRWIPQEDSVFIIRKEVECSGCRLKVCSNQQKCMDLITIEDTLLAFDKDVKMSSNV